jgi:alpha-2-macroglobulin
MLVLRRALALSLAATVSCSPAPSGIGSDTASPAREHEAWPQRAEGEALVFPPPPTRRARRPLPRAFAAVEAEALPEIDSPHLDADGHFEFAGKRLTIEFNRRVRAVKDSAEPALTITPAVKGSIQWRSPWTLAFVADEAFDPDQTYTVELGAIEDEQARRVPSWKATFRADPQTIIAGKVLSYLPEPGKLRVVTVVPHDRATIGRNARMEVLFDQPVELDDVRELVGLYEKDGETKIPADLAHPTRDLFDGIAIDRRHVVQVRPKRRPSPGDNLVLTTRDSTQTAQDATRTQLGVAEPLRFDTIDCGYYSDRCTYDDGKLDLSGHNFTITFNNPIATSRKRITQALRIEPSVKNLSVWNDGWSTTGRIYVSGSFSPSTTYKVHLHGLEDAYGDRQHDPVTLEVRTAPLAASVSMAEGVLFLDEARSRSFEVTTRNVAKASLALWRVDDNEAAWEQAQRGLAAREKLERAPDLVVPIVPHGPENASVTTTVDLLAHTEPGRTYRASLDLDETAHDAPRPSYNEWSYAGRPPSAIVTVNDRDALAVHARTTDTATIVHVARLEGGEPLAGARFFIDDQLQDLASDALGVATLPIGADVARGSVLRVEVDGTRAQLPLGRGLETHSTLTPELSGGRVGARSPIRALIFSDRGAYRPGATMHFKATLRHDTGKSLRPVGHLPVRLRVVSPTGKDAFSATGITDAMGGFSADFETAATAEIGRYQTSIEPLLAHEALATTMTQVAEFEPPRFTVDVDSQAGEREGTMTALVRGRYLFGAAMDDAPTTWTLRREAAPMPSGPFVSQGLTFRPRGGLPGWTRTGDAKLGEDGTLKLEQAVEVEATGGPQRFVLEAEVTDASHRAIAARDSVVLHPADHYAGLRIADTWVDVDTALPVELGVVDREGASVADRSVEVELVHVQWTRSRKPGAGGSVHVDWHETRRRVDRCVTRSASTLVRCEVTPKKSGTYELVARVDGKEGGTIRAWAYGSGYAEVEPNAGHTIELQADKRSYAVGDTAKVVARNPFGAATAIFTVEDGGEITRQTQRVEAGPVSFEVPIADHFAPHVHATLTLLPIGAEGLAAADWRFGATRLPVSLDDKRLEVAVASDRERYQPGEDVEITVDVSRAGTPVADADVALFVVDEGVLRLTNHHAPDPVNALFQGPALQFAIADTRRALAQMLARSQVPGDGGGDGEQSLVSTRENFVHTVLWKPDLRTDDKGRVKAQLKLPDNLTTFRMMAVVLDVEGRGGVVERGFEVQKPLMAVPAVPRFAALGDRFAAATMVHNNEADPRRVRVVLEHGRRTREETVEIPGQGRRRVAFELEASERGDLPLTFSVHDEDGKIHDRVRVTVPVAPPGIDERPRLAGSFSRAQEILMEVPANAYADIPGTDDIVVTVGQHMWPELGSRLEYLVGYPHGCVEQTTSSTLPLLAARELLPRLGVTRFDPPQIDTFIRAGLDRLASMRTPNGGLAYWPGGHESNLYGTAYAVRAIALASREGIATPPGLLEDVVEYLQGHLRAGSSRSASEAEILTSIALGLSEADALPASSADMLWDTVERQGVFGLANLALALATLQGQEDRVSDLLDLLEQSFDEHGELTKKNPDDDFWYYGSDQRTRAQAALALGRLRPASTLLPALVDELIHATASYTTQATAFGLIALREHVRQAPQAEGSMRVVLDGVTLIPSLKESAALGGSALRYRIPAQRVAGRRAMLRLETTADTAVAFLVESRWRRPLDDVKGLAETSAERGPEVYRMFTDPRGKAVDLASVQPGQTLRVALLARLPIGAIERQRLGYLALTDRLPAGFEAIQPDLWTVSRAPELDDAHPLYNLLRWGSAEASHVELRDDRVHLYFDRVWDEYVVGTYLVRATTPGTYVVPPTMGELMYEPDSFGYGKHETVTVVP